MKKKKIEKCEILANKKIAKDHYVMDLKTEGIGKAAKPGQFVSVSVKGAGTDPLLRVPLGIHKICPAGISLLYKVVGRSTELLSRMEKGGDADVLGPLGNFFDVSPAKKHKTIMVAGGHGVAPLYALAEEAIENGAEVEFFSGACSAEHLVCEKEIKKLGAKVRVATDDGTRGEKCYVTGILEKEITKIKEMDPKAVIYACGPRPMLAAVSRIAERHDIPAQVSVDAYMACGIGVCLGCAIRTKEGYKLVCKDGPVFDSREIVWD